MVSGKECNLFSYFINYSGLGDPEQLLSSVQLLAGFTNCNSFKLVVVVREKDFSVETTVVG